MVGKNLIFHADAKNHSILSPSRNELNLLDYKVTFAYMKKHNPDVVIHAAGKVGGIQANIAEPTRFLLDNLDMGRNVVLASYEAGVSKLINLGSSCMYPRNGANPLKENSVLTGELEPTNEGYALAKIATARLCQYMRIENDALQYKTLVPCNLYGLYDKFDARHSHMIPAVIHKLHMAKEKGLKCVDIWGDGTARREFMFAGDAAGCIWKAVQEIDLCPDLMNVGLGYDFSINEYYQSVADVVGYQGSFKHDLSKPVGMKQKLVDTTRATDWGWVASTSLRTGLQNTYKFYLSEINK